MPSQSRSRAKSPLAQSMPAFKNYDNSATVNDTYANYKKARSRSAKRSPSRHSSRRRADDSDWWERRDEEPTNRRPVEPNQEKSRKRKNPNRRTTSAPPGVWETGHRKRESPAPFEEFPARRHESPHAKRRSPEGRTARAPASPSHRNFRPPTPPLRRSDRSIPLRTPPMPSESDDSLPRQATYVRHKRPVPPSEADRIHDFLFSSDERGVRRPPPVTEPDIRSAHPTSAFRDARGPSSQRQNTYGRSRANPLDPRANNNHLFGADVRRATSTSEDTFAWPRRTESSTGNGAGVRFTNAFQPSKSYESSVPPVREASGGYHASSTPTSPYSRSRPEANPATYEYYPQPAYSTQPQTAYSTQPQTAYNPQNNFNVPKSGPSYQQGSSGGHFYPQPNIPQRGPAGYTQPQMPNNSYNQQGYPNVFQQQRAPPSRHQPSASHRPNGHAHSRSAPSNVYRHDKPAATAGPADSGSVIEIFGDAPIGPPITSEPDEENVHHARKRPLLLGG